MGAGRSGAATICSTLQRVHRQWLELGRDLPWSIDAFLSSRDGEATKAHAAFLRMYGLTAGDVPLLMMTPSFDQPFVPGSGYARMGDPTRRRLNWFVRGCFVRQLARTE